VVLGGALVAGLLGCNGRDRPTSGPPPVAPATTNGGGGTTGTTASGGDGTGGSETVVIPDPDAPCDQGLDLKDKDPHHAARALGLCKRAVRGDDWGLVSAAWVMADGSVPVTDGDFHVGHGILRHFGDHIDTPEGDRILVLSSGTAREPGQGEWVSPAGFDKGYESQPPAGYPKEAPACPGVETGATHDDIGLEITVRAPPGAQSFAFDFDFFTYEWPDWVCSPFNDYFLALLDPPVAGLDDGNISFDQEGNPVSVNNALVRVCSCSSGPPCLAPSTDPVRSYDCELGPSRLEGTGFEAHAATGWLTTTAPVAGGDQITLRLTVFDSGDGVLDSTVVLDGFRWLGEPLGPPHTGPK
jgi:hypothetical protein